MFSHGLKQNTVKLKDKESPGNRVNMRNRETWFKISGGGFIHLNAHLQKAIITVTIRLRDTEIERDSP